MSHSCVTQSVLSLRIFSQQSSQKTSSRVWSTHPPSSDASGGVVECSGSSWTSGPTGYYYACRVMVSHPPTPHTLAITKATMRHETPAHSKRCAALPLDTQTRGSGTHALTGGGRTARRETPGWWRHTSIPPALSKRSPPPTASPVLLIRAASHRRRRLPQHQHQHHRQRL